MAPATKERIDVILGWLANQGPQTVLLFLILCGGGYMAMKALPEHTRQVQEGYQRIEEKHTEQVKDTNAKHTEQIKAIADQQDKTLDRIERWVGDRGLKSNPFAGVPQ